MQRRILGLENEYGVAIMRNGKFSWSADEIARLLLQLDGPRSNTTGFLRNGARFYLDVGSHPEYATPECDSLAELIAHDKAGERRLERLSVLAERTLLAQGRPGRVFVFKNNVDGSGNTYGCHENYLVSRRVDFDELTRVLLPFLATRPMVAGAGAVVKDQQGRAVFAFSQRGEYMDVPVSLSTLSARGMINTRDEPHANRDMWRRLHLIAGDANMCETTTMVKVGSTDLVLRMLEAGGNIPAIELADPVRSLAATNRDLTGRAKLERAGGGTIDAVDLAIEYFTAARDSAAREGTSARDDAVMDLWGRTLTAVQTGDHRSVVGEIDWATKEKLVEDYRGKRQLPLESPRVAQLALAYHDIRRRRGVFRLLEARGAVSRVVDEAAVVRAGRTPPQTTRAKARGNFLRAAERLIAAEKEQAATEAAAARELAAARAAAEPAAPAENGAAPEPVSPPKPAPTTTVTVDWPGWVARRGSQEIGSVGRPGALDPLVARTPATAALTRAMHAQARAVPRNRPGVSQPAANR
jgi:proteasome accessory factor A